MASQPRAAPSGAEVWVWSTRLDVSQDRLEALRGLLAPAERRRAERFAFGRDRRSFIAAHGILREILGACLKADPAGLAFERTPEGKPRLASGRRDRSDLRFSMSHSADLAFYAVAVGREVGVDVERIRTDLDVDALAGQFFSPAEVMALAAVPQPQRAAAFIDLWVLKEAWSKAVGCGLSAGPDRFDVAEAVSHAKRTVQGEFGTDGPGTWSLQLVDADPGYGAAVAVAGTELVVRRLERT
jgi:4'-phosphopantetheinyl transferase